MIVFKIHIHRADIRPTEGNPVVSCHVHRPSLRLALQAVKTKPRDIHLLRSLCDFQQLQDTYTLSDVLSAYPAGLAGEEKFFKTFVPEGAYQFLV